MTFFVDLTPVFEPKSRHGAWVARAVGTAFAAVDDAQFLYQDALLPRSFVRWFLSQPSEEAGLRKLTEGAVQFGRRDLVLKKYRGDAHCAVWIEPQSELGADRRALLETFDVGVAVVADPTGHASAEEPTVAFRALFERMDVVCCLSSAADRSLQSALSSIRGPSSVAIPAPASAFSAAAIDWSAAERSDLAVVVVEGRDRDNLSLVLDVWANRPAPLEGWRLIVLSDPCVPYQAMRGDPNSRPDLTSSRNVETRRVGSVDGVRRCLAEARLVIDASLLDPVGRWTREAQRLGTPVVAAIGGGSDEFLRDDGASFFDPSAPSHFVKALTMFAGETWDAARHAALAEASRRGAEKDDEFDRQLVEAARRSIAGRA